jgi:sialic acid synthase SpsE
MAGSVISADDLVALRPATPGCITPDNVDAVIGSRLLADVDFHDVVTPALIAKA